MLPDAFQARYGFPRADARLENWRLAPFSAWTFQNISELIPSASVSVSAEPEELVGPGNIRALSLDLPGGAESVGDFLVRSSTDALVVMKDGRVVADWFAPTCDPSAPHIIFSITKSLTALIAGSLEDEGRLDPAAAVTTYVPDAAGSAFADATVRDVLDMRTSLQFDEVYTDPDGIFARYRRAMLWNPGGGDQTLRQFLVSLQKGPGPHGGPFRYKSPNSDMLGVIVEAAGGERYADLLRSRVLEKAGCRGRAMVAVDGAGLARGAGGVSMTAHDLARIGEALRNGGMWGGLALVSTRWLADMRSAGDRQAWKDGDFPYLFENGSYRSKWYQSGEPGGAFCGIGIHGQWLWVDPSAGMVVVKMSSQPEPVDNALDQECLTLFRTLGARL